MIGAALALSILGLLYRDMRRGALVTSILVAAFFGYGHLQVLMGEGVSRELLLGIWAVLIGIVAILAWRLPPPRIASLTLALDAIAAVLVVLAVVQVAPTTLDGMAEANAPLPDRPAREPRRPGHLLPDLRPVRLRGIDQAPDRRGERPARLPREPRLHGRSRRPRELRPDGDVDRVDLRHGLPR